MSAETHTRGLCLSANATVGQQMVPAPMSPDAGTITQHRGERWQTRRLLSEHMKDPKEEAAPATSEGPVGARSPRAGQSGTGTYSRGTSTIRWMRLDNSSSRRSWLSASAPGAEGGVSRLAPQLPVDQRRSLSWELLPPDSPPSISPFIHISWPTTVEVALMEIS